MSDPALTAMANASEFMPLVDVQRDANAVYLFDFDGVITAGIEDHIYKLDEQSGERERLAKVEQALSLRIDDMEFRYRRHLVFQELALRMRLPIERGAGYDLARWASDNARFFVLTARSGWAATERVRTFLSANNLTPIDLYQVGRVHKDRQVQRTIEEFSGAHVFYIEDSLAHLARAAALELQDLSAVYCSADVMTDEVLKLYSYVFEEGIKYVKATENHR